MQAQYTLNLAQTRERIGELQATIRALTAANTELKESAEKLGKDMLHLRQKHEETLDSLRLSETRSRAQANEIANLTSQLDSIIPTSL